MAHLANRSRFRVTVKNKPDVTRHFSFDKLGAVEAYMKELRARFGPIGSSRPRITLRTPRAALGRCRCAANRSFHQARCHSPPCR